MAHFAPRTRQADEEETITRPLRPAHLVRRKDDDEPNTSCSIVLEPATDPQLELADFSYDEEWRSTNKLPRPPTSLSSTITQPRPPKKGSDPLPLITPRKRELPSVPSLARPSSKPSLPPIPAFTRPISVAPKARRVPAPPAPSRPQPHPIPQPIPLVQEDPVIEVHEQLRVDWREFDRSPTSPLSSPEPMLAYRLRQDTVRGIEIDELQTQMLDQPASIRYAEDADEGPLDQTTVMAGSQTPPPPPQNAWRMPISDIPPISIAAPPSSSNGLGELWRAARRDAWIAFLVLPIAVSLVSIIVLTVTALASSSAGAAKRDSQRLISAIDEQGAPLPQASVFVDGVAKCQATPCSLELADGTHWITVSAPGYEAPPSRAIAGGKQGPQQLEFVLVAKKVQPPIELQTAMAPAPPPVAPPPVESPAEEAAPPPKSAGKVAARTPRSAAKPRGERAAAAPPPEREVAGEQAKLNLSSTPSAAVVLDGRPLGRTPLSVTVAPGPHAVVFINGDQRVTRVTMAVAGKTSSVGARF